MNHRQYSYYIWLIFFTIMFICAILTIVSSFFVIPLSLALACSVLIPEDEDEPEMSEKVVWRKARKKPVIIEFREVKGEVEKIKTREEVLLATPEEDFIIRGVEGEIYPIKKEIFYKTYEVIEE